MLEHIIDEWAEDSSMVLSYEDFVEFIDYTNAFYDPSYSQYVNSQLITGYNMLTTLSMI